MAGLLCWSSYAYSVFSTFAVSLPSILLRISFPSIVSGYRYLTLFDWFINKFSKKDVLFLPLICIFHILWHGINDILAGELEIILFWFQVRI